MMRTLREDYCPVCREKTVLAMYERLPALITEVVPEPGTPLGDDFASSDVSLTLLSDTLNVTWTIDGEVVGAGTAFEGACGGHLGSLLATVTDDTDFVRDDPAGALVQSVGPWPIETKDCTPGPVACGCNATRPTGVFAWLLVGVVMLGRRRGA